MKVCSKCKKNKELTEFYKHHLRKDGLQSSCKECNNDRSKKHYQANKNLYLQSNAKRVKLIKEWLQLYKESNPCKDCGRKYPYYVMDFDHLRDKIDSVSHMIGTSKAKIAAEIAKYDLVCANCHRIRTFSRIIPG